jgi:hypothetical protein
MFEKEHRAKLLSMPQFSTQLRGLRVPVRRVVPMPGIDFKKQKDYRAAKERHKATHCG